MTAPRYQNILAAEIPEVQRNGAAIRVIAGAVEGVKGPIDGIAAEPLYLDITVERHHSLELPLPAEHASFSYIFEGEGEFGPETRRVQAPQLVVWDHGDQIEVRAREDAVRFLLVAGRPLREPIVRYGPFVMNTKAEIEQTLRELQQGTFAQRM